MTRAKRCSPLKCEMCGSTEVFKSKYKKITCDNCDYPIDKYGWKDRVDNEYNLSVKDKNDYEEIQKVVLEGSFTWSGINK